MKTLASNIKTLRKLGKEIGSASSAIILISHLEKNAIDARRKPNKTTISRFNRLINTTNITTNNLPLNNLPNLKNKRPTKLHPLNLTHKYLTLNMTWGIVFRNSVGD